MYVISCNFMAVRLSRWRVCRPSDKHDAAASPAAAAAAAAPLYPAISCWEPTFASCMPLTCSLGFTAMIAATR
jgi:hypothetical protein